MFSSAFQLNDPELPPEVTGLSLADLQKIFAKVTSKSDTLLAIRQSLRAL